MSANLKDQAAWNASVPGTFSKQVLHRVPPIPSYITLAGKTALVTGASSGLGLECARQFLQLGASRTILAVRSQSKGETAAQQLRSEFPVQASGIEVWLLDMESYDSIRDFAARCQAGLDRLDVVVLNAGCGKQTFQRCGGESADGGLKGRETMLQVNYLATTFLSILLIPIMKEKRGQSSPAGKEISSSLVPARLTIVGSDMALWTKLDEPAGSILDMLDSPASFDGMKQYSITKLLLMMAVPKLASFVDPDEIIVNLVNPSSVRGTDLMRDSKGQYMTQAFVALLGLIMGRNLVDGTRQYVHSALVLGKESHGSFTDWQIRPFAPMLYSEQGLRLTDNLWHETLSDLNMHNISSLLR